MDTQTLKPSQNEWFGIYAIKHNAKLIKESLENENSPLLPDKNGTLKAVPITNANTGWVLNAKDLIPAQLTREKAGYKSTVVGTKNSMDKSNNTVLENEKGLTFNFSGQDGKVHGSSYFFPEQTLYPEKLIEFSEKQSKSKLKLQNELSNETIKINSASEYLPAYLASAKSGATIQVTPEVAAQFKQNMLEICNNELVKSSAQKNPAIPKLSDIMFESDKKGLELIQSVKKERGLQQIHEKPQQQNKQEIERE